jgi:hypothetical protein
MENSTGDKRKRVPSEKAAQILLEEENENENQSALDIFDAPGKVSKVEVIQINAKVRGPVFSGAGGGFATERAVTFDSTFQFPSNIALIDLREMIVLKSNLVTPPMSIDSNRGKLFVARRSNGVDVDEVTDSSVLSKEIQKSRRLTQRIAEFGIGAAHKDYDPLAESCCVMNDEGYYADLVIPPQMNKPESENCCIAKLLSGS